MPRKRRVGRPRKRRHSGSGIKEFLQKAHDFIKKHKVISKTANALGALGVPHAGTVGSFAHAAGYGRRRRYRRRY